MSQVGEDSEIGSRLWAHEARLRLLFRHLAGPAIRRRVEVDDLVQETFLRALSSPAGMPGPEEGEAALWRWLVAVARHCTVDVARALRARKREGRVDRLARSDWSRVGVRESAVAAKGPGPGTAAGVAEELERLARAFERLSADHRRVIGLRQFEGLDAREAGRRMGRGEAAVHSLYRRALMAWEVESGRAGAQRQARVEGRVPGGSETPGGGQERGEGQARTGDRPGGRRRGGGAGGGAPGSLGRGSGLP